MSQYIPKKTKAYKAVMELKKQPHTMFDVKCSQVFKVCEYLSALVYTHNLTTPYDNVVIKDDALLEKFGINDTHGLHNVTRDAMQLNIIILQNSNYSPLQHKCRTYNINIDKLQELYVWATTHVLLKSTNDIIPHIMRLQKTIHYKSKYTPSEIKDKYTNDELYEIIKWAKRVVRAYNRVVLGDIDYETVLNERTKIAQRLQDWDYQNITNFNISPKYHLDHFEKRAIGQVLLKNYLEQNRLIHKMQAMIEEVNKNQPEDEKFVFKIRFGIKRNAIYIKGRLINPVALQHKENYIDSNGEVIIGRNNINARDGFDSEFDMHSEAPALIRAIHGMGFDIDQDMKTEASNELGLDRDYIKLESMRTIFMGQPDEVVKNWVNNWMGGSKDIYRAFWFYEAQLILYVMRELQQRNCRVRNAYDCYYFRSSEISLEEVKAIISDGVQHVVDWYNNAQLLNTMAA